MKRIAVAVLLAAVTAAGATPSIAHSTAVPTRDISVGELKLRAPVTGSDGESVGVINRISASSDGKVTDVDIALGTAAGIDAKTVRVSADKINVTGGNVGISMSSDEVRKSAADQGRG